MGIFKEISKVKRERTSPSIQVTGMIGEQEERIRGKVPNVVQERRRDTSF